MSRTARFFLFGHSSQIARRSRAAACASSWDYPFCTPGCRVVRLSEQAQPTQAGGRTDRLTCAKNGKPKLREWPRHESASNWVTLYPPPRVKTARSGRETTQKCVEPGRPTCD